VGPFLLHQAAAHPKYRGNRGDLSRVIRLDVANRNQRITALRHRIRCEPFEFPYLVPAEREARGNVVTLGPDLDPKLPRQPRQGVDWLGPERELATRESLLKFEGHGTAPHDASDQEA
jgi:hypothetical protein